MHEVFEKIIDKLGIRAEKSEKKEMDAEHFEYAQMYKGERIAFGDAIEIVKQEAEKYNNGWIPCSEQQPEESGTYNITAFDGGKYRTTNAMWQKRSESWNLKGQRAYWSVIAWQPLPAPYNPHICTNDDCAFNVGQDCPAAEGCGGYERKRTNFDMCCESVESMAQIIDIAKIGWTKEQIMEWLQKEECEVPE